METNYTLKRLKLFGTMFAVLIAVFMLSSFKAEAQTVTITGPSDVCLPDVTSTFQAAVTGIDTPTFTWSHNPGYGLPQSGTQLGQFTIEWKNKPTCQSLPPSPTNWAWVSVQVQSNGTGPITTSDPYYVNLHEDYSGDVPDPTALFYCEDAEPIEINGFDPQCAITTGTWAKTAGPEGLTFDDPTSPVTTVDNFVPGVYTLTWTLGNPCTSDFEQIVVLTIYETPTIAITVNAGTGSNADYEVCYDGSFDIEITSLTGEAPFSIDWTLEGPPDGSGNGTFEGIVTDTYNFDIAGSPWADVPGIYTVTFDNLTDANCVNSVYSHTFTIEILEKPAIGIVVDATVGENADYEVCWDGSFDIVVTATAGNGDYTVDWELEGPAGAGTGVFTDFAAGTYEFDLAGSPWEGQAGIYTITFTNLRDEKCSDEDFKFVFTMEVLPMPVIDITVHAKAGDFTDYEVCWNGSFSIEVDAVKGTEPYSVEWELEGPAGAGTGVFTDFAEGTYEFDLAGSPWEGQAGIYTVTFSNLIDAKGCADEGVIYSFTIEVLEKPEINIIVLAIVGENADYEVCFDGSFSLEVEEVAGALPYSIDWMLEHAEYGIISGTFTDVADEIYTFDLVGTEFEDMPGIYQVTLSNLVDAKGCADMSVIKEFSIEVRERPEISLNEIVGAQEAITGPAYTVFCSVVPGGYWLFGKNIAFSVDDQGCDVEYRWQRKVGDLDAPTSWEYFGENEQHLLIGELTQTYSFRRLARTIDCLCPNPLEWNDPEISKSNEITIYVVEPFVADIGDVDPDAVCIGEEIVLAGNEVPFYALGQWTSVPAEGIVISDVNDPVATVTATVAGVYTLTWGVTNDTYVFGCEPSSASVEIAFEQIVSIADLVIDPNLVCEDSDAFELTAPAVEAIGEYTYEFTGVGVSMVEEAWMFNPLIAGPGVHTVTFTVTTDAGCVDYVEAAVTVMALPDAPVTEAVDVCFDGEPVAFDVEEVPAGHKLWWSEYVNGSWTAYSDAALPTKSAAGTYQIRVKYQMTDAPYCEGPSSTANLTIRALPEITDVTIISENTCYGEVIEIDVVHTYGAVLYWSIEGAHTLNGNGNGVTKVASLETTTLTFDPEELNIGVHTLTMTVVEEHPNGPTCTSLDTEFVFTVTPPVYAMFSPYMMKDESGDIIDIPYVQAISGPNTPKRIYVPVTVADNGGLFVEFSDVVNNVDGLALPLVDQGEFIILEKLDSSSWVKVNIKVEYVGNKAIVTPFNFTSGQQVELDWDATYRLRHANVYKSKCGTGLVGYRLDKIDDGDGMYDYDEWNTLAYESPMTREVIFSTMPEQFAYLPYVYPIDDDARCKTIEVVFQNPVMYRSGQRISTDINAQYGNPTFKFKLEKRALGSTGIWSIADIIDVVVPKDFENTVGLDGGPKRMVFHLTEELEYGMEYRVMMNPSNDINNGSAVYGFTDMVLGLAVLDVDVYFHTANTGYEGGWSWSTSPNYDIMVYVEPAWTGYATPAATATLPGFNNVLVGSGNPVVTQVAPVAPSTVYTIAQDNEWTIGFADASFSMQAVPGQGYKWDQWHRSLDGGTTWAPLAKTHPTPMPAPAWVEGINYFPQSFTFRPNVLAPTCEQDIEWKATFVKKKYDIIATVCGGGDIGVVSGHGNNIEHGSTVTLTAVPKPGYYFVGWNLSGTSWGGLQKGYEMVVPVLSEIMDPTKHSGTLTFELLGEFLDGEDFVVCAQFATFNPHIYAAAHGVDDNGVTLEPNITDIEFTTLWVSNILLTGVEPVGGFPDLNEYEMAIFKYGNPSPTDVTKPLNIISVSPKQVPCEYEFVKWERWNPETEEWFDVSEDEVYVFIPTENYRLRAVFVYRSDVMVSVQNDVTWVTSPEAMGSILVELVGSSPLVSWYNDVAPRSLRPGDKLKITVIEEPNHLTYGWVDQLGNKVSSVVFKQRYIDGYDRTEWEYTVGCESIDLYAVISKKRYLVTANVVETYVPTTCTYEIGGTLFNSLVPVQANTAVGPFGYHPEDTNLGFAFNTPGTSASGWFVHGTEAVFTATVNTDFTFHNWRWSTGGVVSSANPYTRNITAGVNFLAYFNSKLTVPTWDVVLLDEPAGAALYLDQSSVCEGCGETATKTVTVSTAPVAGYDFVSWNDLLGNVVTTTMTYSFIMPKEDVTLVATFEKTEYDLELLTRTYLRNRTSTPFTGSPYDIGEKRAAKIYGGTVNDLTNNGPYVSGDVVNLRAIPNPGFRLVNWMVGSEIDVANSIFRGTQVNPISGVTVYPASYTFNYTIPAQYGETVVVVAVFAEATIPMYPVYRLTTAANPAGYGITTGGGHFAHGVQANIAQTPNKPGYQFSHWTFSGSGNPFMSTNTVSSNVVNMTREVTVTANYVPINYNILVQARHSRGNITWSKDTTVAETKTGSYTINDVPIQLTATEYPTSDQYIYVFNRWTYDAAGNVPVRDQAGNAIVDPQFSWIPLVPTANMSDNGGYNVTIYAQFDRIARTYLITLQTALSNYTNIDGLVGVNRLYTLASVGATPVLRTPPYRFAYNPDNPQRTLINTTANSGYAFKHWTDGQGNVHVQIPEFNWLVTPADVTFIAVYNIIEYDLVLNRNPIAGGTVSGAGKYTVRHNPTAIATPATGWRFVNWTRADGSVASTDASYTWPMPANNVTLTANFEKIPYTVTASVNPAGAGTFSGTGTYYIGDQVNMNAVPNTGWMFAGWTTPAGDPVSPTAATSFTMSANNVSLVANFTKIDYTLAVNVSPAGKNAGTVTGASIYNYQDPVTVTATPNTADGWSFVNWTHGSSVVSENASYSFNMPASNYALTANFEQAVSSIAGQVRYYNQFGTPMPSPSSMGSFEVSIMPAGSAVKHQHGIVWQDAKLINGQASSFLFENLNTGTYHVRVRDNGYTANRWNSMGITATDALIIQQMAGQVEMPTRPWLWDAAAAEHTAFGKKVAGVRAAAALTTADAYMVLQRVAGQIDAFTAPDFQVAAAFGPTPNPLVAAPNMVFNAATGYFEATIEVTYGDHVLDLFYIASADVRARAIPQQAKSAAGMYLDYEGVQRASIGQQIEIPVALSSNVDLGALTLALNYNNSMLQIDGVSGKDVVYTITEDHVSIASIGALNLARGETVVTIQATVLGAIKEGDRFFEIGHMSEIADRSANVIEGVDFITTSLDADAPTNTLDVLKSRFEISNFPNPFNEQTTIRYTLPEAANVTLVVYNQMGQVVRTLVNENQEANVYDVDFHRESLLPGMYIYKIVVDGVSGSYSSTNSMMIMR